MKITFFTWSFCCKNDACWQYLENTWRRMEWRDPGGKGVWENTWALAEVRPGFIQFIFLSITAAATTSSVHTQDRLPGPLFWECHPIPWQKVPKIRGDIPVLKQLSLKSYLTWSIFFSKPCEVLGFPNLIFGGFKISTLKSCAEENHAEDGRCSWQYYLFLIHTLHAKLVLLSLVFLFLQRKRCVS